MSDPTEMQSTPVSAISRTVASETLPDASSFAMIVLPRFSAPALRMSALVNPSSRITSGLRGEGLLELLHGFHFHFDAHARRRATCGCDGCADRARRGDVVLLDQHHVEQTDAVVRASTMHSVLLLYASRARSCAC